jgi:hypothetical protein
MRHLVALALAALVASPSVRAQNAAPDTTLSLASIPAGTGWAIFNRRAEPLTEPGRENAVYLDAQPGQGVAWVPGLEVADAVIEVEVRGRNVPGGSFVGLAFYGTGAERYEGVYLRPFNFQVEDPVFRARAIQYVSVPTHEWRRLRVNHPGEYEAAMPRGTDPDDWVALRVELEGPSVRVYVDGAAEPTLEVDRIGASERGWVGIWVGEGSDGSFANLRVTPLRDPRQ